MFTVRGEGSKGLVRDEAKGGRRNELSMHDGNEIDLGKRPSGGSAVRAFSFG